MKINEKIKEENKREIKRRRHWLVVMVVVLNSATICGGVGFVSSTMVELEREIEIIDTMVVSCGGYDLWF